jgi:hypothetical protein
MPRILAITRVFTEIHKLVSWEDKEMICNKIYLEIIITRSQYLEVRERQGPVVVDLKSIFLKI